MSISSASAPYQIRINSGTVQATQACVPTAFKIRTPALCALSAASRKHRTASLKYIHEIAPIPHGPTGPGCRGAGTLSSGQIEASLILMKSRSSRCRAR